MDQNKSGDKIRNYKLKRNIIIALIVLWIAFIFAHSAMSAEASTGESGAVMAFLRRLIEPVFGVRLSLFLVRKSAHLFEFFVLGVLFASLLRTLRKERFFHESYAFLCGLATAVADESIQLFSYERTPKVADILIDCAGVLLGILIFRAVILIASKIKKSKK